MDGLLVFLLLGIILHPFQGLEYDGRLICSVGLTPKVELNNHYVWCKKGQICSTTSVRFGTAEEFSLGCNSKQNCASGLAPEEIRSLITMSDNSSTTCCDTMGCNGMKVPKGYSLCTSCPTYQLGHPAGCATVKMCDQYHQCFYQKIFASSTSQILHEMRCETDKVCNAVDRDQDIHPPLVGRSIDSTFTMMKQCCRGDLCNLRFGMEQNHLISNSTWDTHQWQSTPAKTEPSTTTLATSTSVTTDMPTTTLATSTSVTTDMPTTTLATSTSVTTDMPTTTLATSTSVTTDMPTTTLATSISVTTDMPTTTPAASTSVTTDMPTTEFPSSTTEQPSTSSTPITTHTTNTPSGHTCYARSPGGDETTIHCHAHEPYCLSHIVNYADGQREVIKGCVSRSHCESFFHMDSDKCEGLSNNTTLHEDLTCSFCCTKDLCNSGLVPKPDTLYQEPTTTPAPTTTATSPLTTPTTSTAPPTTTSMVTTTTTLPTTTKQPKPSHVDCYTCSNCGIHRAYLYTCSGNSPFCMTEFSNAADGYRVYTKRCASARECNLLWYQSSKTRKECANFEPNDMYYKAFNCHFCCIENECNKDSKPSKNSLYIP